MSDILNSSVAVTKPNPVKEIKNDIQCKEFTNDFIRKNIFSWVVLGMVVLTVICVTITFLYRFFADANLQNYIIEQIKNNIVFIICTGLAILKINIPKK